MKFMYANISIKMYRKIATAFVSRKMPEISFIKKMHQTWIYAAKNLY